MPSTILDERSSRLLDEFLRVHPRLRERGITGGSPEYNQVRDTLQQYIATRVASGSGSIDDVATKMGMENRLARLLDSPRTQTQIVPQSVPEPTTPSLPESSIQHTATSAVPQTQAVPSASIEVTNSTERLVRAYVNRDRQPNRYEEVINHLRGLYPRGIPDNNMLIESRIRDYFKANPGERQPIPQVSGPIETPPATQQVQPSTEALAGTQAKETSAAELADSNLISSSALTNIADDNAQPILLAKEPITSTGNDRSANTKNLNAPERNIAKDDDVVVNEAVREAELLAREYESNPDLFSNRNLVLRARKVTFSGNSIEFKLPSITATPSQPPSSPGAPGPNPLATLASMPAPAGQAVARETAMSATPAAISMGAAAGAASSTGLVTPTSGRVTSPFGMRSMGDHKGIDYGVPVGTPIVAAHGGTVVEVRESPSYGNMIRIRGDNGIDTLYAHLSSFGVQQGQQVTAGQQIALSGNTGRSTGPHLHFEAIRNGTKIDPAPLLGISGSQSAQSAPSQTPEPAPSSSDASPVASTPATAAASIAPSSEQSAAPAQMMAAPATDGAAVEGASRDNAIAERTPAAASAPNVIDMSGGGASNSSTPPPAYNSSDPNDPGLVEPEDAAERYARLFDMAA
jgi:murein DD-endopeptidase MepM/ murein hydrolase activator NlpD